ncbi:DUF2807 domain-containing protein [Isosphaeraceae bacterium EP7]
MRSRLIPGECSESRLSSFLDDRLPEPENAHLAAHLDQCENCRKTLERLAAGSRLWADLREMAPDFGPARAVNRAHLTETTDGHPRRPQDAEDLGFLAPPAGPGSIGRLGVYDVVGVLGRGGFGIVMKATDPSLGRLVAIKVLSPHLAANASARGRFAREAKAAAAVVHENVVAIHSVDSWNGLPYLVMPCVAGPSLQKRVDGAGPLSLKEILRIGMQAALGLAAAHDQGIIHRDVKPSNILLGEGVERVKLSDFGLARAVDDASVTQSGVISGTPQYMSPEQARGEPADHRSDLFSLGGVLYFMGAGHPPFRADSTPAVLRRVCDDPHRPLDEVNPDIPGWLAEAVDRLLAKQPAGRFSSAAEVADVLRRGLADLQRPSKRTVQPPIVPPPARVRPKRKFATTAILASAALLALVLGASPGNFRDLLPPAIRNFVNGAGPAAKEENRNAIAPIVGSGHSATKDWELADFTEVTIGSTFKAEIVKGDAFKVITTSDDNLVEFIQIVKDGKRLKVGMKSGQGYHPKEPLKVRIELPAIDGLDLDGSSRASIDGFRSEGDFKLKLDGSSTLDGSIDLKNAEFQIRGSSKVTLAGSAEVARLSVGGSSRLLLAGFRLTQCDLDAAGSSKITLATQAGRPFRAKLSGSSDLDATLDAADIELALGGSSRATLHGTAKDAKIKLDGSSELNAAGFSIDAETLNLLASASSQVALKGAAKSANLMASGNSRLKLADLVVGAAVVKLSGSSKASLNVQASLMYHISSGSKLEYSGDPALSGSKSSGAEIRRP